MVDVNIDYTKLLNALNFYQENGFKNTKVPWVVSPEISAITKPAMSADFFVKKDVLVASAEQSFLQLISDNKLAKGRYCALTPCFRDEIVDELHQLYFMKVELIDTLTVSKKSLAEIVLLCVKFFEQYTTVKIVETGRLSQDILDAKSGIELGSYGIRGANGIDWIYATGCAEPRLSFCLLKE